MVSCATSAAPVQTCDVETGRKLQRDGDYVAAAACFDQGAAQGMAESALLLGSLRLDGLGIAQDSVKAQALFEQAAEKGLAPAMYNLGVMKERGLIDKPDYAAAAQYYRQAADLGMAAAQLNLAILYLNGKGVPKDYEKAERLLIPPADQDDQAAQFNLGLLYFYGFKAESKIGQASVWLERAAMNGHRRAPQMLAIIYAEGRGVKPDMKQAYTWFLISNYAGNPEAKVPLASLESSLSATEREEARKNMESFLIRQKAHIALSASAPAATEAAVHSRCAVLVKKIAAPTRSGADGETAFKNVIDQSNQSLSGILAEKLKSYRILTLEIAPADNLRAMELANRAMSNNNCSKSIEVTNEFGGSGESGYLQFNLNVYKSPVVDQPHEDVIHTKVYRTSMRDAFKLDVRSVADVFIKDLETAGILNGILR